MSIIVYARKTMAWQVKAADSFRRGLLSHGITAELRDPAAGPKDCDLAVMWSNRFDKIQAWQKDVCQRYLIMERGYLGDRQEWVSIGFDGLNGGADFANKNVPSDRWDRYWKHGLKRARSPLEGSYILVIGQVPGDASLADFGGDFKYLFTQLATRAREEFGRRIPVFFRPHPLCFARGSAWGPKGFHMQPANTPLHSALDKAAGVITWSSTTGVESVMAGIPTVALSPLSMVHDIAENRVTLKKLTNRNEWGQRIAYAQWTYSEIESGAAWEHLKGVSGVSDAVVI